MPRGEYGRGRPKSVAHPCPQCARILLPRNGFWPFHYTSADTQLWCKHSDRPYPQEVDRVPQH